MTLYWENCEFLWKGVALAAWQMDRDSIQSPCLKLSTCYYSVVAPPTGNKKCSSCHNHHSIYMKFSWSGLHVIHNKKMLDTFFFSQCLIVVTAQSHANLCRADWTQLWLSYKSLNWCINCKNSKLIKKIYRKNTGFEPTSSQSMVSRNNSHCLK